MPATNTMLRRKYNVSVNVMKLKLFDEKRSNERVKYYLKKK
jgi:hypothetical protein